jgi:hypothetical protein
VERIRKFLPSYGHEDFSGGSLGTIDFVPELNSTLQFLGYARPVENALSADVFIGGFIKDARLYSGEESLDLPLSSWDALLLNEAWVEVTWKIISKSTTLGEYTTRGYSRSTEASADVFVEALARSFFAFLSLKEVSTHLVDLQPHESEQTISVVPTTTDPTPEKFLGKWLLESSVTVQNSTHYARGVIVSEDGLCLSIADFGPSGSKVTVSFGNNRKTKEGKVIRWDPWLGISLIRFDTSGLRRTKALSMSLNEGAPQVAFYRPLITSLLQKPVFETRFSKLVEVHARTFISIQHDKLRISALDPFGGALVDSDGKLVGVLASGKVLVVPTAEIMRSLNLKSAP